MIIVKSTDVEPNSTDVIEIFDTAKEFKWWINDTLINIEDEMLKDNIPLDGNKLLNPYSVEEAPLKMKLNQLKDMLEYEFEVV